MGKIVDDAFMVKFKRQTERRWAKTDPISNVYGFQFKRGTKWNPGLSSRELRDYEKLIGTTFPAEFRCMLLHVNGTDLPTINLYGSCGEPVRESVGVYSFPRDSDVILSRIQQVNSLRIQIAEVLADQGYILEERVKLTPIYIHRFLVCGADASVSTVLSIHDTDAIVYAESLYDYLRREFLHK